MLYEEGFTQNREISWLRYNERVLEEALDETVPLLERLRFIGIFSDNLEEFFRVRVGSLLDEEYEGSDDVDKKSGMTAGEQLRLIHSMVPGLLIKKDMALSAVEKKLEAAGVSRAEPEQMSDEDRGRCFDHFRYHLKDRIRVSVLTKDEPLPELDEERPYVIAGLDAELEDHIGIIDIPQDLPKVFVLEGECFRYVLTEDIVRLFADTLFIPFLPLEVHTIDIARNAALRSGDRANTAREMKKAVKSRRYAPADRLITDGMLSEPLKEYLERSLGLGSRQIFSTTRLDFSYIDELEALLPDQLRSSLVYEPHIPHDQTADMDCMVMDAVRECDILSSYPYDSMDAFLSLLREAAFSDEVREIRITIYRLASHPKIAEYLMYAARNGKKVRVVLELRARFDEERNLVWAEKLSAAGCRVYYGADRYKVHSKLCQLVLDNDDGESGRKDGRNKIDSGSREKRYRYITQISTGNYNEKTAKLYTDLSFMTYDQETGRAVSRLFRDICKDRIDAAAASPMPDAAGTDRYSPLLAAPFNMRSGIINLIRREAAKGENGLIIFKVNSLTDREVIEELMEASCAGCRIRMIVRGICCMLPGVKGCTENVCIVNRVGRFLEHSRVYLFGEGRDEEMYISSADLMTRNLDRRVEVACPVKDPKIKDRIRDLLAETYCDTGKGRVMLPTGEYARKKQPE